jgi:hypothetical protein
MQHPGKEVFTAGLENGQVDILAVEDSLSETVALPAEAMAY